ncbi:helix-turn-helix transcriptional regulator [Phaeobacter sp.]|uniref:helix-turn-helix transcriptional regulator n=1 Tax=Phaeobacter sp. TaxID=1902409 RepID=UPI0025EE8586|nr:helix-turn-helix transcriptional regulator [Phaeobacter sp.]
MVEFDPDELERFSKSIAQIIEIPDAPDELIAALAAILPFDAALCVVNHRDHAPTYLTDTYTAGSAKSAVQLYVSRTYVLNPVHNALQNGLKPGVYLMSDLAPDNWNRALLTQGADVLQEDGEEIGYRTPGWPSGLQELTVLVELPDGHIGEVSIARAAQVGGFSSHDIARLQPFQPLIGAAFRAIWCRHMQNTPIPAEPDRRTLTPIPFGEGLLTPREIEVVQLILKGHSSLSISLTLDIAIPTVKTHRKNAYAKLAISSQSQLLQAFLNWKETA